MEIWAAAIGVLGSALIALAIYRSEIAVGRSNATMDLVREVHSSEISHARARAQHFVLSRLRADFDAMEAEVGLTAEDKQGRESLFILTRFFYRVNVLRKSGHLQNGKLFELFGPLLAYWWKFAYEEQLARSGWSLKAGIQELYEWFRDHAAQTLERQVAWEGWLKAGSDARALPAPVAAAEPAPSAAIADEIRKLWDLQQNGVLTLEEFDRRKARLLASN